MRQYLPAFAHLFGIREWEIDRLTLQGFDTYAAAADDYLKDS